MRTHDFEKFFNENEEVKEGQFLKARVMMPTLTDYTETEMAKASIKGLMQASGPAIEELINLAIESQSFKHYDALASMIKALNESSRFLHDMSMSEKKHEQGEAVQVTNIQNNTVFTGRTTELLRMIREEREKIL